MLAVNLREAGLGDEEIKRVIDPMESFQLRKTVTAADQCNTSESSPLASNEVQPHLAPDYSGRSLLRRQGERVVVAVEQAGHDGAAGLHASVALLAAPDAKTER